MKYIDAEKLIAEIERRKKIEGWCAVGSDTADVYYARGFRFACDFVLNTITSLQQEQPEGVQGTVHHYGGVVHYVVTNQEQLNARLKQFPNDAEVEIFIEARKEIEL